MALFFLLNYLRMQFRMLLRCILIQRKSMIAYQLGLAPASPGANQACPVTVCNYVMQFQLKPSKSVLPVTLPRDFANPFHLQVVL
jgi:hypothetical protein